MITRRILVAGVASATAAEFAWARCGSGRTQQIVLTGRISAIGAKSMQLVLVRGVRTILFSERFDPAGFSTGFPNSRSEARSAMAMMAALTGPVVMLGKIEASHTESPSRPRSLRSRPTTASAPSPMRQVPTG